MTFYKGLIIPLLLIFSACDKEDPRIECSIYGAISSTSNNGVTVTLESTSDSSDKLFAVSDEKGKFEFHHVPEGRYSVSATKEDCQWVLMSYEGVPNHRDRFIDVEGSQDKTLTISLSDIIHGGLSFKLELTDYFGSPIGTSISIDSTMTSVSFRLYNGTNDIHSWDLRGTDDCFVEISDPVEYQMSTEKIFTSVSPLSGKISPGEKVYIIAAINPEIFKNPDHTIIRYSQIDFYDGFASRSITLNIKR